MIKLESRFTPINAPCQDKSLDSEIFFPDPTEYDKIKKAKSICSTCDQKTKQDCLEFGIATKSYGIWGGTTEKERQSIKRRKYRGKTK